MSCATDRIDAGSVGSSTGSAAVRNEGFTTGGCKQGKLTVLGDLWWPFEIVFRICKAGVSVFV